MATADVENIKANIEAEKLKGKLIKEERSGGEAFQRAAHSSSAEQEQRRRG